MAALSEPQLNAEAMDQGSIGSLIAANLKEDWGGNRPGSNNNNNHQPSLCATCGVVIRNAANVEVHMKRHLGYKPYACSVCAFAGYDEDDVRRHAARAHHGRTTPSIKFAPASDMEKALKDLIVKSRTSALTPTPEGTPVEASPFAILSIDTSQANGPEAKSCKDKSALLLGSLTCTLCQKSLPNLTLPVLQHLKAHLSCPTYACPSCCITSNAWAPMARHAAESHHHLLPGQAPPASPLRKALASLARSAFPAALPRLPCALCNRLVEWSEAGLEEHLRHHSSYAPLKCGECGSAFPSITDAQAHMGVEHPGVFPSLLLLPELEDELRTMPSLEAAFPMLASDNLEAIEPEVSGSSSAPLGGALTPSDGQDGAQEDSESGVSFSPSPDGANAAGAKAMIDCRLCGSSISRNMSCLIAHSKVHLAYKPLHCEYCSFKHFAMSKVRRHTGRVHPDKPVKVTYHQIPDINKQLKDMKTKCFGSQANSAAWANGGTEARAPSRQSDTGGQQGRSPSSSDDSGLPGPGFHSPGQQRPMDLASNHNNNGRTSVKEEGDGKKACFLCRSQVAANAGSLEHHACKHLDYKPFHCTYCRYQSYIRGKVTQHIAQAHPGSLPNIEHRPEAGMGEKVAGMRMRCFPGEEAEGGLVPCAICAGAVSVPATEAAMDEHVHTHISQKTFHCPVCTYQTPHLIRAKQHVHSAHPHSQETRILCCPPDGLPGLRRLRLQAYGPITTAPSENQDSEDEEEAETEDGGGEESQSATTAPPPSATPTATTTAAPPPPAGRISCSICRALLSNQPAAIASHVRNHLDDYKPYHCAYCTHDGPEGEMGQLVEASVVAGSGGGSSSATPLHVFLPPGKGSGEGGGAGGGGGGGGGAKEKEKESGGSTSTLLKKLICQLCKNTIADNPKSVGIHVKNHLGYKPYRCPFCRYMSCEQSKARRHVEHVHSVSGDLVEIHAEEGIKERIAEMKDEDGLKARCFPQNASAAALAAVAAAAAASERAAATPEEAPLSMVPAPAPSPLTRPAPEPTATTAAEDGEASLTCQLCQEAVAQSDVQAHVESHQGPFEPFSCPECGARFGSEEGTRAHLASCHPDAAASFPPLEAEYWTIEGQLASIKEAAFPQLVGEVGVGDVSQDSMDSTASPAKRPRLDATAPGSLEGKLSCTICEQSVSCNPNSLDVHAKTHLAFKQHKCGYCTYRSCISGKVKRHLDNVHKGLEPRMRSLTDLPASVKQIIADMRGACFPQTEPGEPLELALLPRSKASLNRLVETLKTRLVEDLTEMGEGAALGANEDEGDDKTAALEAAAAVTGPPPAPLPPPPPPPESQPPLEDRFAMASPSLMAGLEDEDEDSLGGGDTPDDGEDSGSGLNKLQCQLCRVHVADNPSSLGLHVRNHLDYKPFSCRLCDYKSCIQAKVKRHLRNVHKCNTLEMTYAPETDIRLKVQDMKLRCFPRIVEAAESAQNGGLGPLGPPPTSTGPRFMSDMLDSMMSSEDARAAFMAAAMAAFTNAAAAATSVASSSARHDINSILQQALVRKNELVPRLVPPATSSAVTNPTPVGPPPPPTQPTSDVLECRLCSRRIRSVDREAHCQSHHGAEALWHCSECGFGSFLEPKVGEHAETEHPGSAAQPVRFEAGPLTPESLAQLVSEAFAPLPLPKNGAGGSDDSEEQMEEDEEAEDSSAPATPSRNLKDGPRYTCQKCGQGVSMYASSLNNHVKGTHMGYKPYACRYCDYRSPVKNKVRRHISNAHKGQPVSIDHRPLADMEAKVPLVKKECFPNIGAQGSSGKTEPVVLSTTSVVPCNICKMEVGDSLLAKTAHAQSHADPQPWHCGHCSFAAPAKAAARKHCAAEHPGLPLRVNHRPEDDASHSRIAEIVELCFGPPAGSQGVRLGPAFREWHCPYCPFTDTSKYNVKSHCVAAHPGRPLSEAS